MKPSREVEIRLQELVSSFGKLRARNRNLEKLLVDQTARAAQLEQDIRDLKNQLEDLNRANRSPVQDDTQRRKLSSLIEAALTRLAQVERDL